MDLTTKNILCEHRFIKKEPDLKSVKKNIIQDSSLTVFIYNIKFSSDGNLLAVSFANGKLILFDTSNLNAIIQIKKFKKGDHAIYKIAFSHDNKYLAVADTAHTVSLYHISKENGWYYVGQYISHYKSIVSLMFNDSMNRDENLCTTLLSLGEDGLLQEYDINNSSVTNGLLLKSSINIEQPATPTSMAIIKPTKHLIPYFGNKDKSITHFKSQENLLIIANDEYKIKVWHSGASEHVLSSAFPDRFNDEDFEPPERICIKTVLAPTYGQPLSHIFALNNKQYLVYASNESYIGLIHMPLNGNPIETVATIAHPAQVKNITQTYDGKYLVTTGAEDKTVKMWSINTDTIENSIKDKALDIEPYKDLIRNESNGSNKPGEEAIQELIDYFYYAQIRSQGINTTSARAITGLIPINEVINIMQAVGLYLSIDEIKFISTEIRFYNYNLDNRKREYVNFDEFIKLYVNYRAIFGIDSKDFEDAFNVLFDNDSVPKNELIKALETYGDKMNKEEINSIFKALMNKNADKNAELFLLNLLKQENSSKETQQSGINIGDQKSDTVSVNDFIENILGLDQK